MNTLLVIFSCIAFAASTCDFSSGFCSSSGLTCPSSGRLISISGKNYNLADIDVISFNDLTLTHGDIQNRVAVRNNFYGSNGVSVGDQLTDGCGYGLIVGGNINWNNDGAVFPVSSSFFVGGTFSGPDYIKAHVTSCASNNQGAGCLSSYFDELATYWTQFSSSLAAQQATATVTISGTGIATLTCNSATATTNYATFSSSEFNQVVGYETSGCSATANWVFNLAASVTFNGNPISVQGFVIYNIVGSGDVNIISSVSGAIVAPNANINQVGGTCYGPVIAGNFTNVVQINTPSTCPASGSASGSNSGSACSGSANGSGATGSANGSATGSATGSSASASGSASTSANSGSNSGGNVVGGAGNDNSGAVALIAPFLMAVVALAFV